MAIYSSYNISENRNELSVKYSNLYIIDGRIVYVCKDHVDLPYVNKFINNYQWRPDIYIGDPPSYENNIKLAALGDCHWYGNIGHALWTGLYPIYTALCKFNFEHEVFDYFTTEMDNQNTTAYPAIKRFIGGNIYNYTDIKLPNTHIETLVAGTGSAGDNVMRPDYTMYNGGCDALKKYSDRMYRMHNISQSKSNAIKILWIDNKRYTTSERLLIEKIVKERKNIQYVDFPSIKGFYNHLQLFRNADIQITAPGTAMIYLPFMQYGSVNVNLGHMEWPQKNMARPNIYIDNCTNEDYTFPAFMEQSLCNACYWTSSLYYDRYTYNELEYNSLNELIDDAIQLRKSNKVIDSHHNIDAKIFVEYCSRVDHAWKLCNYLTGKALYIEFFVNEHPYALPDYIDLSLLRSIKDEFGYNRAYEYNA